MIKNKYMCLTVGTMAKQYDQLLRKIGINNSKTHCLMEEMIVVVLIVLLTVGETRREASISCITGLFRVKFNLF